ncbi:MAG: VIT1/CCC1 transporter family protein [Chitinophagales bacterium]|nr:VIT1/CCC1 transporter family protein [Chitinophagales bacterium]
MKRAKPRKLKKQLQIEVDTSFLYRFLSEKNEDKNLADIFSKMSAIETTHAQKILNKMQSEGIKATLPPPSFRARTMAKLAKVFGFDFILSTLMATEQKIARASVEEKVKKNAPVTGKEITHVRILNGLAQASGMLSGSNLAKFEGKHKSLGGNALRAAVLGANDGLVSNLSLIMGVAGATSGNSAIVVAGFAGLLAGAISMALGEWLSVQSSRELHQRQIDIETEELETSPEEEMKELTLIYRAKGIGEQEAESLAKQVLGNKETAVESLVREELGMDTEDLGGSAWTAAITSFLLFAVGAIIPLVPFLFSAGFKATLLSLAVSTLGLFFIGAMITFFTGKSVWYSGMRQVLFGLAAAAITFGIGKLVGVSIA